VKSELQNDKRNEDEIFEKIMVEVYIKLKQQNVDPRSPKKL
jgi:hypothetical protein